MNGSAQYQTKQQTLILAFLSERQGLHITVRGIVDHFRRNGIAVGTATVYRQLEKMVRDGTVKKYTVDAESGACFEFVGKSACGAPEHCFHFKCESCGKLMHFHCPELEAVQRHMSEEHGLSVDTVKTVYYGICTECSEGQNA
ncbi:Fur family transcriptional regulator [Treponema brennaborense]|uniref:Ferric uptake regulator, Fur family n=1 Tax=Treponema brennaborense (strain DSM 12168 / CIP 105900 / DD5/3) TaxID=906968 RepID=F4LLK9_TREBD|nr:transcriptional repressor [Treponema brennaborense]AEE16673.1 ferric uptake regulator, Fur family [Treponema brennaborense DSM 12168]